MKKLLICALALLVTPTVAYAEGWYVGVQAGVNKDDVISNPKVNDNLGFVGAVQVGTHIASLPGVRVELEAGYSQNDVEVGPFGPTTINASHETTRLMANAAYEFGGKDWPVTPYVLAGAGYAYSQGTFEDITLARVESGGFAWQLGAGLTAEVEEGVHLGVGYRFLQTDEINVLGSRLSDGTNHSGVVELRFAFK